MRLCCIFQVNNLFMAREVSILVRETYAIHPERKYDPKAKAREACEYSPFWRGSNGGSGCLAFKDRPAPRSGWKFELAMGFRALEAILSCP